MVNRGNEYTTGQGFEKESVQSLWREAMVLRDLARDGISETRERRAEVETARRAAEQEALKATEEFCQSLRERAEADLEKAASTLNEAERLKHEVEADLEQRVDAARADSQARQDEAEAEYEKAVASRDEADSYAQDRRKDADSIVSAALASAEETAQEAREHSEDLVSAANGDAEEIRDEMRRQTAGEIRSLVANVESARSSVLEELETQRILTDVARIKATSPGLSARNSERGSNAFVDSPAEESEITIPDLTADLGPELILLESEAPARAKPQKAKKPGKTAKKRTAAKPKKKSA